MNRKAWRMIPKAGSINNLTLVEEELVQPGEKEVTVEIKAIGLNFADIFTLFGLYGATPKGSFVPGLEYSGIVKEIGEGVSTCKPGDKVMGTTKFGAYTTHLNIEEDYLSPLPDDWSFEEGAAFVVQALTAYYALVRLADIQNGATVLIHSAAGGVGILANRVAKKFGAYTIGTVSSNKKVDFLKKEGYDDVIVRGENFRKQLKSSLGDRELNIVMDSIGGQIFRDSFRLLAPEGRIIVYGSARYASTGKKPNIIKILKNYYTRPKVDPQGMVEWNKSIMGFNLIHLYHKKNVFNQALSDLYKLNIGKQFVGHTYTFENLKDAISMFQTGRTMGKVVVTVEN
ncbi:zinc-binding dehydrogenase [Bacteroidota bacterium]